MDAKRLARIRQFLVYRGIAERAEDGGLTVNVYTDEIFVHQAHGFAYYSFFASIEDGVVQDDIGRTTGKGLRMIVVHAITKHGPLATYDQGVPIEAGWFSKEDSGRGKQGGKGFEMKPENTA